MNQKRQNKSYPPAFKAEALALISEQGYSVPEAARALGIRDNLLYRWKKLLDEQNPSAVLASDERQELMALRREVKTLRMEKDILKKASAFFAKEMT